MRTVVNVTGDAAVTTVVAHSESEMDIDRFNDPGAGVLVVDSPSPETANAGS